MKPDKDFVDDALGLLEKPLMVKDFDNILKEKLGISDKKVTSVKLFFILSVNVTLA